VLNADPTLVRLIQWETLEGHGQILGAIGSQAQAFVELIKGLGEPSGAGTLDETTATELLICVTAMCWFPLAHADAMERTFHRDSHSPEAVAAQATTIVEFVLMRLATLRSTPAA
jgi:hypothetical protein